MATFVSKYKDYRVGLKRGYSEVVNGHKVVHKPIKAKFQNYMFNTENCDLPLDEKEIVKTLRKNKFYGKDFWEKERDPITVDKLLESGIRELNEIIDEIDDMTMLKKAIDGEYAREKKKDEEPRKTAIKLFKDRLNELLGDVK